MEYVFIFGRNVKLSLAELFSYLENRSMNIESHFLKLNSALIQTDKEINIKNIIPDLGGSMASGKVLCSGNLDEVLDYINKNEIYFGESIKVSYTVLNLAEENSLNKVFLEIKNKFKKEKLKARYRMVRGVVRMQSGKVALGTPSNFKALDMVYFLCQEPPVLEHTQNSTSGILMFKGKDYKFGVLESFSSSDEVEKRDMEKPVRRESLAISPRLAKILINLSGVKSGERLIDPFCGIGVILSEALIKGINVIGVDVDYRAIENAKRNLAWLEKNYNINAKYELINDDSRKIKLEKAEGVATEPALGELLKTIPNEKKAQNIIKEFEDLIAEVLNNLKVYVKGKIAFTAPLIKTGKIMIGCNIDKIIEKTGLKLAEIKETQFPIQDFREDQIVGREIYVLINSYNN